jgi:hypothetical protein
MFRIDIDRMYVVYSIEDRDLALAFLEMEGMSLMMPGGLQPIRYLTNQGHWEQRICYKSKEREKSRVRDKARHAKKKEMDRLLS